MSVGLSYDVPVPWMYNFLMMFVLFCLVIEFLCYYTLLLLMLLLVFIDSMHMTGHFCVQIMQLKLAAFPLFEGFLVVVFYV